MKLLSKIKKEMIELIQQKEENLFGFENNYGMMNQEIFPFTFDEIKNLVESPDFTNYCEEIMEDSNFHKV